MSQAAVLLVLLCFLSLPSPSFSQVTPTAPGPGDVFPANGPCPISWTPDPSGQWTSMTIQLMSGQNMNMTPVALVAQNVDGTNSSLTPFSWTCPQVDPYSAIYFYQFSQVGAASPAWTTRFAISGPDGTTVPPENADQPSGEAIPWGTGQLAFTAPAAGNTTNLALANSTITQQEAGNSTLPFPTGMPTQSGFRKLMQPSSTTVSTWVVVPVQTGVSNGSALGLPNMAALTSRAGREAEWRVVAVAAVVIAVGVGLWRM